MKKLKSLIATILLMLTILVPAASAMPVMAADSSWRYPLSDSKRTYNGVTFYNPHYVISKNKLP